jgi:TRAP-type transport system periplasmic protein
MNRRFKSLLASLALGASLLASPLAEAAQTLRVATLVPKNSSWGKVYRTWQKAVKTKTDGNLEIDVFYNGVQGMEDSMVAKMKSGQLDGALLSSAGLSTIYRDIMVLQLPDMIRDWATLDKVRKAMDADLKQGFAGAGFTLLAWSDVGLVREFSKGFEPRRPQDIKGKRPLVWRNDLITPTLYGLIGTVVPVPLSPGEVLPALRTGKVDYILAPALAAEQLQWGPYLDYVTNHIVTCAIGGTVVKTDKLDKLPADVRQTFFGLNEKMASTQAARVRKDDAASFERLSKTTKLVQLTPDELGAWQSVMKEAVKKLGQGTFPAASIEKVRKLAGG